MENDPRPSYKQLPLNRPGSSEQIYLDAFGSTDGRHTKEFLWHPQSNTLDGKVELGDVGVVQEGTFIRMWNITTPFRQRDGPNYSTPPPGFKPPKFDPVADVVIDQNYMLKDVPFCSAGIHFKGKKKGGPDEFSSSVHLTSCYVQD